MRVTEDALRLLRRAQEEGGQVHRHEDCVSCTLSLSAFEECKKAGLIDSHNHITLIGEEALKAWAG